MSSIARACACCGVRLLIAEAAPRAMSGRGHQRRDAVDARQIDERAVLEQQAGRVDVGADRGAQQRRRAGVQQLVGEAAVVAAAARPMHVELRVRIDAGLEQQPDEVRRRGLGRRRRVRLPAAERAHVGGDVQRRAAVPIPDVRVRACVEQHARGVVARVVDRDHQRRHAFGRRLVDVGAGCEQRAHAARAARARRVQERGQSADGAVLRARLRRDLRVPVVGRSAHVHVGAVVDQELRELREVAVDGPDQRRLIAPGLFRVDVGAALDEQLRDIERADARREHQRRLAVAVRRFDVGAGIEQLLDELQVAELHGFGERARAVFVRDVGFGAVVEQLGDELAVDLVDGPVQRRRAVALSCVDVGAAVDQLERGGALAVLDQVRERALRVRRGAARAAASRASVRCFIRYRATKCCCGPRSPCARRARTWPGRSTSDPCLP